MKILQVSANDFMGQQFNGFQLHRQLRRRGVDSAMAVFQRRTDEPGIAELGTPLLRLVNAGAEWLERRLSLYSVLPVLGNALFSSAAYRASDVVHLQLPHVARVLSLLQVPRVGREKKLVWTLHDPWMLSGHCLHSLACQRWQTGCGECPDLTLPFPIRFDTTAMTWRIKRRVVAKTPLTVVAASQWMLERIRQSPIFAHVPCRLIPFGVDPEVFFPRDKAEVRRELGIPEEARVIAFRSAAPFPYKGTEYVERALALYKPDRPTWLLTFEGVGGLDQLRNCYHFKELGWVADPASIARAMSAADVFLMPSTAETFGLMAIEALSCGTPVVCFEGTALPWVIDAPNAGLAVDYCNPAAIAAAIEKILSTPGLQAGLREHGLALVAQRYSLDRYVDRHLELYRELVEA